ncbi:hypothetical protein MSG28_001377 [Choristoneura fumiferana]|uniref:Uncharacterized protein n=1 Tax=Choristoneura fumiferana TaxID=7141 RepID=A0ACC0KTX9_CHOFU|nr:hypothetical protein MSG28_001377 [Choristoneura fumiferana]
MMLKSIYFITLLLSVQCWVERPTKTGIISNLAKVEAKNESNIPPDGYIAYGRPVQVGEFPWMTSIDTKVNDGSNNYNQCGGSLISDKHVLTAAHCVVTARQLQDVIITVGDYIRNSFPKDCDAYNQCTVNHRTHPARVTWHQKYNPNSLSNDIAMLKLAKHVNTGLIRPINLPPFDVDDPRYENAPLTVAGWGRTESSGKHTSNSLLATEVNLKTRQECYKVYYNQYPEAHLCAGKPNTRTSSCKDPPYDENPQVIQLETMSRTIP